MGSFRGMENASQLRKRAGKSDAALFPDDKVFPFVQETILVFTDPDSVPVEITQFLIGSHIRWKLDIGSNRSAMHVTEFGLNVCA